MLMGRQSQTKSRIIIHCDSELYTRFYILKKEFERLKRRRHNNKDFLNFLLQIGESELVKMRFRLKCY